MQKGIDEMCDQLSFKEVRRPKLSEEWRGLQLSALPGKTRRNRLFWVGLLGMVACLIHVIHCATGVFGVSLLFKFPLFVGIMTLISRICLLGCCIVLMASDIKWRRSFICWLGVVGMALLLLLLMPMPNGVLVDALFNLLTTDVDYSTVHYAAFLLRQLLSWCAIFAILPVFKMMCLVPGLARFIGAMGVWILIIVRFFNTFFGFSIARCGLDRPGVREGEGDFWHDMYDAVVTYVGKYTCYGRAFGYLFPLVASIALFVFFSLILVSRSKTFEPVAGAWHAGRAKRSEYWGKTALLALVGEGGALLLFFGTGHSSPEEFSSFVVRHPLVHLLVVSLWALPFCIASLPVTVRRLHDVNLSGWWILWWSFSILLFGWLPFVGWFVQGILFGILGFIDGTPGPNKYGPDPKGRDPFQFQGKLTELKDEGFILESEYEEMRARVLGHTTKLGAEERTGR